MEFPSRTPCKPEVEPAPQPPVRKKKAAALIPRTPSDSAPEAEPDVEPPPTPALIPRTPYKTLRAKPNPKSNLPPPLQKNCITWRREPEPPP